MIPRDQLEHWIASKRHANAVDAEVLNIIVALDKRLSDLEELLAMLLKEDDAD